MRGPVRGCGCSTCEGACNACVHTQHITRTHVLHHSPPPPKGGMRTNTCISRTSMCQSLQQTDRQTDRRATHAHTHTHTHTHTPQHAPESLSTAHRLSCALRLTSPSLEPESLSLSLPSLPEEAPAQKRDMLPRWFSLCGCYPCSRAGWRGGRVRKGERFDKSGISGSRVTIQKDVVAIYEARSYLYSSVW